MPFCRKCGTRIKEEGLFCPKCGLKLQITKRIESKEIKPQAKPQPKETETILQRIKEYRGIRKQRIVLTLLGIFLIALVVFLIKTQIEKTSSPIYEPPSYETTNPQPSTKYEETTQPTVTEETIQECESHVKEGCYNEDIYWFDSCGNREELVYDCGGYCFEEGKDAFCEGSEGLKELESKHPSINYASMEGVRNKVITIDGAKALLDLLDSYDGFDSLSNKKMIIEDTLAKYPHIKKSGFSSEGSVVELEQDEYAFLVAVTHAIWLEENGLVPWSLKEYSQDEVNDLLLNQIFNVDNWGVTPLIQGNWKTFHLTYDLIKGESKNDAIRTILAWSMKNFFHYYSSEEKYHKSVEGNEEWGCWVIYKECCTAVEDLHDCCVELASGPRCKPDIEELFEERAGGCHFASGLVISMLRSINIPSVYMLETDIINSETTQAHGVIYIPEIGRYIHGDLIADLKVAPPDSILMTKEEFTKLVNNEKGYVSFEENMWDLFKYNAQLHRKSQSDYLYISISLYDPKGSVSEDDLNYLRNTLNEYNLDFYKEGDYIQANSALVKIQKLY